MHIGIAIFATEYAIRIDELAREAEARRFESLWVPEHTHIPTSRRSPFAGGRPLPEEYKHTLDPFVALTAAAAATTKLRVGTGICLIIERDTITTAKAVASLDLLSHGRFELGIGGGWNAEEMAHHGADFATRFKRLEEQVRALKEIWTKDVGDIKTISVSAFATPPDRAVLDQFAAAGVTRSIFLLPPEPRDKVLPLLDQYAKLIR